MIIQIDVRPETAALIAEAQRQGVSIDALLCEALNINGESIANEEHLSLEEWETELQELIDSPSFTKAPPLPDEAFSRESIYTREDDLP